MFGLNPLYLNGGEGCFTFSLSTVDVYTCYIVAEYGPSAVGIREESVQYQLFTDDGLW